MKRIYNFTLLFLSLLFSGLTANAQAVCNGTWGAPIIDVTFGEGSSNSTTATYGPLEDYAPGATTTTTFYTSLNGMTLSDGESTLATNPKASNQGSSWISIGDHTGDPNGLMMLINAPSNYGEIFFGDTLKDLCPNTTLQLSVWMLNVNDPSIVNPTNYQYPNMTIRLTDPVTGSIIDSANTGDVPADKQWHNYTLTFNNGNYTNILMELVNLSVGTGFGNDLALDDISVSPCVPLSHVSPKLDTVICQTSMNLNFNANITGNIYNPPNYIWQYSTDSGATWNNEPGAPTTNPAYNFSANTSGVYWFRFLVGPYGLVGNSSCSGVSDTSIVRLITTVPNYNILDTVLCHAAVIQLHAKSSSVDTAQFQWEFSENMGATWLANPAGPDSNYSVVVYNPGTYWVRYFIYPKGLENIGGCKRVSDTSVIRINPPIVANSTVTDVDCYGKADGKITLDILQGKGPFAFGAHMYGIVTPMTAGTISEDTITGLDTGTYFIVIKDSDKVCIDTLSDVVVSQPASPLSVLDTSTISPSCLMNSDGGLTIAAQGGSSPYFYELQPVNLFSYDGHFNNLMQGTYTVTVHDNNRCTLVEDVPVHAQPCCKVFMPDAFTPNNDGKDDRYHVVSSMNINNVDLHIFNRYGQEVFHGTGTDGGWDGTVNGTPADMDSYFYVATYICSDTNEQVVRKGSFILVR